MSALEWQKKMTAAPDLRHENGMVLVSLAGRAVLFPSEADARFFHAAYTAVPALEAEVATLRREIDEKALHAEQSRAEHLEAENAVLRQKVADLEARNRLEIEQRTAAKRRATVLAKALRDRK